MYDGYIASYHLSLSKEGLFVFLYVIQQLLLSTYHHRVLFCATEIAGTNVHKFLP